MTHRGSDQKLAIMAPVLLTGLSKITDQPDEVGVATVCLLAWQTYSLSLKNN